MTLAFRYAARTDVGLVRDGNEDSGYAGPNLLAVADGMGGAVAGELASAITIETVRQHDSAELDNPVEVLSDAATTANGRILARIKADPRLDGMGTTLTAGVLYDDNVLGLVHIGDSRAYLLRDGELKQLTHDHTFVQSLVDEGKLTPQQAEHHPHRSLIIRVLDGHHDVQLDVDRIELRGGDWLLFCSDGLGNADIRDSMIAAALAEAETPEDAALELIRKALRAGSPDNVTCVVAEVVDLEEAGISPDRAAVFLGSQPVVVGAAAEPDLDVDQELELDASAKVKRAEPTAVKAVKAVKAANAANAPKAAKATPPAEAEVAAAPEADPEADPEAAAEENSEETTEATAEAATEEAAEEPEPEATTDETAEPEAEDTATTEPDEPTEPAATTEPTEPTEPAAADKTGETAETDGKAVAKASTRPSRRFRWVLAAMALSIVGVLAVAGARFAFNWTQQQYYIGSYPGEARDSDATAESEHVAIFRGVNREVPGIQLSSVLKVEQIRLDQLPARDQRRVEQTITVSDLDHAVKLVTELREVAKDTNAPSSATPVGTR